MQGRRVLGEGTRFLCARESVPWGHFTQIPGAQKRFGVSRGQDVTHRGPNSPSASTSFKQSLTYS